MKSKLREFYNTWDGEDVVAFTSEPEAKDWAEFSKVKEIFRVREIDPRFDALVLEMVETLKLYQGIAGRDCDKSTTKWSAADSMLKKYDAYVRGEKK